MCCLLYCCDTVDHICTANGLDLLTALQPAFEVLDNTSKHGCNYVAIQLALVTPLLKHYFPTHVVQQIKLTEWEIGLTETERAHPDRQFMCITPLNQKNAMQAINLPTPPVWKDATLPAC